MAFTLTWKSAGVVATLSGTITDQEMIDMWDQINSDPRFSKAKFEIINSLAVTEIGFSGDIEKKMVVFDRTSAMTVQDLKFAMVADQAPLEEIGHRYIAALAETSWQAKMFVTIDEAKEWVEG